MWCGIRPLAQDPSATDTADAVRDHLVIVEGNGMVTVTGGKWTTYRYRSSSKHHTTRTILLGSWRVPLSGM